MAQHFTDTEWQRIEAHLNTALAQNPQAYGLPERRDGSVILMSWNIRKFGAVADRDGPKKSPGATRLIKRVAAQADLLSIQEQQDDTGALEALVASLAPFYGVIYSDVTGRSPGHRGMSERFAFMYRHDRVRLGHLASDLSYDRTAIAANMNEALQASFDTSVPGQDDPGYLERLMAWVRNSTRMVGSRFSSFVQFIRSPYLIEFVIDGTDDLDGQYQIYAVNAHLVSGRKNEREQEFFALLEWLLHDSRKTVSKRGKIIMIMGDLNLDFDKSNDLRRVGIENYVTGINAKRRLDAKVNFPFLDGNFQTNARRTQTYDHIAWIADDTRLARGRHNDLAGTLGPDNFDYGMFDFTQLFIDAGPGRLPDGTPDYDRFAHDLTDHMPIWVRLPLPAAGQHRFTT